MNSSTGKTFFFIFSSFLIHCINSSSITCNYTSEWSLHTAPKVYSCIVIAPFKNIVEKNVEIELANDDPNTSLVFGINFDGKSDRKVVNFIPKGIANFFPNLKYFRIGDAGLKEIHQDDFKPFPNLTHVSFFYNTIEVIEEGLFDFNPLLEFVWFEKNEIKVINPDVFKNLKRLTTLDLRNNKCISDFADNDVKGVRRILQTLEARMVCLTPEYILNHYPKLIERFQQILEENAKSHVKLEMSEIIIIVCVICALIIVCVIGVFLVKKDKKNKKRQIVNNQNYDLPKAVALPKPPDDFLRDTYAEVRYSVSPSEIDHTYETIREPVYKYDQLQREV